MLGEPHPVRFEDLEVSNGPDRLVILSATPIVTTGLPIPLPRSLDGSREVPSASHFSASPPPPQIWISSS